MVGIATTRTTAIELQIASNHLQAKKAFYDAENGIAMARAANFYRDDIPAEFTDDIEMYEEVDEATGKVIKVTVVSTGYAPSKSHPNRAVSVVEAGFVVDKDWESDLNSALYVGDDLVSNGVASMANGSHPDHTEPGCEAWDVMSTGNASDDAEADNWSGGTGDPAELHPDEPAIAFDDLFDHMLKWAEVVEASNNLTLGTADGSRGVYQIVDTGGVKVNNLDGYGVLLVDGDMEVDLGGSIGWNGIIMVRGNLTFNGGGYKEIIGAVLSNGSVTDNGAVDVYWDCAVMEMLKEKYTKYRMTYWMQP
jgi:hypothetical protein